MVATVTVTGYLGTRPEHFRTQSGVEYARFRMAHTPRLRRDGEWADGETLWLTVRCYGKFARNVVASLRVGDPVLVTGQWRFEEWADKNGVARSTQVIMADAVGPSLTHCEVTVRPPVKEEPNPGSWVHDAAHHPAHDAGAPADDVVRAGQPQVGDQDPDAQEPDAQKPDGQGVDGGVGELVTSG